MLKRLKLYRYKGFKSFQVRFGTEALLVGPNNAGKTTIIGALKLCNAAARLAMRVRASDVFRDENRSVRGWALSDVAVEGVSLENVRHELREEESYLELEYSTGALLRIVWPVDEPAFFWIGSPRGDVVTAAQSKVELSRVGVVPTLAPLEDEERLLSPEYLAKHVDTRRASRHFRNSLGQLQATDRERYAELLAFLLANTPELASLSVQQVWRDNPALDLYFVDSESRTAKEMNWAGDGLQIWLQILFHVWRTRAEETLLLDEPDVFLHPDLQRRLVRILEASGRQTIMSTHAAEVASEANTASLIWVERKFDQARRITTDSHLESLSTRLGTSFNLSIAKALKSRVALFVEGDDMKVLSILARKCGCPLFATEDGLAVTAIGGFTHWPSVQSFSWIRTQFLGDQVDVLLLVDRDYRSMEASTAFESQMRGAGVAAHVWRKKELESYLLIPQAIVRVSGAPLAEVELMLENVLEALRWDVQGQVQKIALEQRSEGVDVATALAQGSQAFDNIWSVPSSRLEMAPAKKVMSGLNGRLQGAGYKTVSPRKLATAATTAELDAEMRAELRLVESHLEEGRR